MPEQTKMHPFGHGGDIETAAQAFGLAAGEIIDFSANINPLGLPPGLQEYLAAHLPAISAYPDPACRKLTSAIKRRYQPCQSIVVGNGAGELIFTVMRVLPAGPVLIPAPGFTLYAKAAQAAGREVIYHYLQREHDFALQVEQLCQQIRQVRPALVMLCNPNNPTGCGLKRAEILAVSEVCAQVNAFVVVDEAFLEFSPDWQERTLLPAAPDNVIVLCSLTKMYAIPGLRLGFMTAAPGICEAIQKNRDPWSVNTLAQLAGEFILQDTAFLKRSVAAVAQLSQELYLALKAIPALHPFKPTANYILLESLNAPSYQLQEQLLRQKILIRDCGNYQGLTQSYVRVAVRTQSENQALLEALRNH